MPAIAAAGRFVFLITACSFVLAHAIWVDLLHRRPAVLPLIAAAISLCFCIAGVFFPALRFD